MFIYLFLYFLSYKFFIFSLENGYNYTHTHTVRHSLRASHSTTLSLHKVWSRWWSLNSINGESMGIYDSLCVNHVWIQKRGNMIKITMTESVTMSLLVTTSLHSHKKCGQRDIWTTWPNNGTFDIKWCEKQWFSHKYICRRWGFDEVFDEKKVKNDDFEDLWKSQK